MVGHIGGLWESNEFELRHSHRVAWDYGTPRCKHASTLVAEQRDYGQRQVRWFTVVPAVVVMWNEGGYATTGVCAECVADAVSAFVE